MNSTNFKLNKKKYYYLFYVLKSHYCKVVFLLSLFLTYLLIPKKIFYGYYTILAIMFMLTTSFTITCFTRNIKEKALNARKNGASIMGVLMIILGFGALQACTIGSPVCGASIGMGILALIFPGVTYKFINEYSLIIIILTIILQIFALYFMKCYKKISS